MDSLDARMQRSKQINERGDKLAEAINEALDNKPGIPAPIGYFCLHFEFMNPDGEVGVITNANKDDVAEILKTILKRMTN